MGWSDQICSNREKVYKIFKSIKLNSILFVRVGLVEARVIGARAAEGDVIVILDAHCECVRSCLF